jgi:MFS family permease
MVIARRKVALPMPGIRIAPGIAFYLSVSILVSLNAAAGAPIPLWTHYEAEWHLSPITITIVYGVYALTLLAALLTVGSLSDHVGRRPVILAGLVLDAVAMVVFVLAGGLGALLIARMIQGLATGTGLAAVGAAMVDLDRKRGTLANGIASLGGFALGALGSSVLVEYAPAPTRVVYIVLLAMFLTQSLGVTFMAETSPSRPGALASLRPNVKLPRPALWPFVVAVPILIATWGLSGFYASLGPALVKLVTGSKSIVAVSLATPVYCSVAAAAVVLVRNFSPSKAIRGGSAAMLLGVTVTLLGITGSSSALFFLGTAVAGAGFGSSFQGVLRTVLPCAEANERAGLLSAIYIVAYLGLSVPVVIAGVVINHGATLVHTSEGFAGVVILLATLALAALVVRRPKREGQPQQVAGPDEVMARAGCLEAH